MDFTVGFSQFFSSMVELFGIIYTSGYLLFSWLATPLSETAGDNAEFLGDLLAYTPFELMFGPALIMVLVLALVKYVTPF